MERWNCYTEKCQLLSRGSDKRVWNGKKIKLSWRKCSQTGEQTKKRVGNLRCQDDTPPPVDTQWVTAEKLSAIHWPHEPNLLEHWWGWRCLTHKYNCKFRGLRVKLNLSHADQKDSKIFLPPTSQIRHIVLYMWARCCFIFSLQNLFLPFCSLLCKQSFIKEAELECFCGNNIHSHNFHLS